MDSCSFLKGLGFSEKTAALAAKAEESIADLFGKIEKNAFVNQAKVQKAFFDNRISSAHFNATTGYGYDDEGRDALDRVYAQVFGAEAALVRPNMISGTHAIATMLFALLRPGDCLVSVTGTPYDTLHGVISGKPGSLSDFGIGYREVPLADGAPDRAAIAKALKAPDVKAVLIQRSRGYQLRPSLTIADIRALCSFIRAQRPEVYILVDNCYGEFVETEEPAACGADLMAGSLIKNPGGGLAPTGGYIAGVKHLVEMAADRLTAPGIGLECGSNFGMLRSLFQGFYVAPHVVSQSLKTALFCCEIMALSGYEVYPKTRDARADIIQAVTLGTPEKIIAFCRGIQEGSPVDSHVSPIPWDMPGYDDQIIMAAGAFVQGSSIEISCDAPIRPPYAVYMQGSLTYEAGKLAVLKALDRL